MKCYHDSRNDGYRRPYGAIQPGTDVTFALDVWDGFDITVALRTWIDGVGESRYEMSASEPAPGVEAPTRYRTTITPDTAGVVWYQFAILDANGREQRYGALDGRTGGEGALFDWEPPSFQLTVYDPSDEGRSRLVAERKRIFEDALSSFLCGRSSAHDLVEAIEAAHENAPLESRGNLFGLLAHCDKVRLLARFAGDPGNADCGAESDDGVFSALEEWQRGLARGRLWNACLLEMLWCGLSAPYGNSSDPDDVFGPESIAAWKLVDEECGTIVCNVADLRRTLPELAGNSFTQFALNDDVFGFMARDDARADFAACVLVNRSIEQGHDVSVPLAGEAVSDVCDGYDVQVVTAPEAPQPPEALPAAERCACVHLHPRGSAVLYFHPYARLNRAMDAGVGVLAHITSIPAGRKPGTLGAPARKFVDWLAKAGVQYWQVLPVNPTDMFGSPYAGISAFAGNTWLLEGGFDLASIADSNCIPSDGDASFRAFCEYEADWLEPYAYFMAIRQKLGEEKPWQDWPAQYRTFDPDTLGGDEDLRAHAETWRRAQFAFEQQWHALRSYANERGVQIIGDMPIYVSADSADTWANPAMFQLGPDGKPAVVAGCPPDNFAEEGQVWGNPVYDWDILRESGYAWWIRRLERAFSLYDWVRLDHFIGFARYFSIPNGQKALAGAYRPGPGEDLFRIAFEKFGPLPIVAEDLGTITPAIRALGAVCGFPGMDIVQFADGNDPLSGYTPRPGKIVYTGTHDNQTLVGYCAERYPDLDAAETAGLLMDKVLTCGAPVAIVPLQDVIGLDDSARMNVPGTAEGNWIWRAKATDVRNATSAMRSIVSRHKR